MAHSAHHPALRKRVVIIFLGAVLLPSLILCYLGLKSIQQEKDRQERIHLQNLENTLSLAVSRIESDVEDELRGLINQLPPRTDLSGKYFYEQIRKVQNESDLVDAIFLLNDDLHIIYPRTFFPGDRRGEANPAIENPYIESGEFLEARGNVREALAHYEQGLELSTTHMERLALLVRVARCELKLKKFENSLTTYRKIINLDNGRFLGRDVPYVLIAYYQIANITAQLDSQEAAVSIMLDNYELLLENFYRLPEAQYAFYVARVREKIEQITQSATEEQVNRYNDLQSLEIQYQQERFLREFIEEHLIAEHKNILSATQSSTTMRYIRVRVDTSELVIAVKGHTGDARRTRVAGLILNRSALIGLLCESVESHNTSEDIKISLLADGTQSGDSYSVSDDSYILTSGLSGIGEFFPGYKIGIAPRGDDSIDALFMRSLILYYILFATIIGLIIFGVVFIFRDISREEEFSRLKSEFISNVSHEIKTPIATIRTLAENLNEGWISNPDKQRSYFHLINKEAERLSHLAENILDFSRIEARRKTYRKEKVNPNELSQKILKRFKMIYGGEDIKLNTDIPGRLSEVELSPESIEQAVLNLLDNAVKYSDTKKEIDFRVEQRNGDLIISVTDYGIGIPKNEQQMIFEKFYRSDSNGTKKIPGSGIGLSLVKEIAEMHNGRIDVSSEVGRGSTFSLVIPINGAQNDEQNTPG